MSRPTPVIFDSDGCIVACDALWWGLWSPDVEVLAVTAAPGVVPASVGAANFARVLHAAGRSDVPLAVGIDEKLGPAPDLPPATGVHGDDGLGNTNRPPAPLDAVAEPAHELIARLCAERPGEIVLVSTGPFGNVARALGHRPGLVHDVADLIIQGMAARPPGNATAVANFNMAYDPTAGAEMVSAAWPFAPKMVGMDVTYAAPLTDAEFEVLQRRATPQAAFMADPFAHYRSVRTGAELGPGEFPSMDTLCFMTLVHPDLVEWEELPVEVDNAGGPAWGMSVVDFRARLLRTLPPELQEMGRQWIVGDRRVWNVALGVDTQRFRRLVREFWGGPGTV